MAKTVLLEDIESIDNGAKFLNVDLHVHSYGGSHDVKDATMTPEAIVDSAAKQGLSVIAITDHNSNKNVETAIKHAAQYEGKLLVLAGVEVTTAHGHLLAYFAPNAIDALAKFLTQLDLIGDMGDPDTRTSKSMADTISIAHQLGGVCIAAHIDRNKTGFHMFAPDYPNWKKDIITSPGLYGLECDSTDGLTWFSADDAGDGAADRNRLFEARETIDELKPRHHLAHVMGSDAHSMQEFEHGGRMKRWTRAKLNELTFSSLRVALIDPTARVRARPSLPQAVPRVRGIAFTGGFLHEEIIQFSDNLNCFIGGRGTGKSTAIRAIAYALGIYEELAEGDNCPDSVTVYCDDGNGIIYEYVRSRGGDIDVKANEDGSVTDVPADAFRVEYYGQNELAEVAKDPIENPGLLQAFLDRHTSLGDLIEREASLVADLQENAGRMGPLEVQFSQLADKKKRLDEIRRKLKVAEEGKLSDVVSTQSKLASEKTVRESTAETAKTFKRGWTISSIHRNFDNLKRTAGECTDDTSSTKAMDEIKRLLDENNTAVTTKEKELNALLRTCATELDKQVQVLKSSHQRMSNEVATKLADLKAKGVVTSTTGLQAMLQNKTAIASEIASIEQRAEDREKCREERETLRTKLREVREDMTRRRKAQLQAINNNLKATIGDYTVFIKYDDAGITREFGEFMRTKMHGSYLQDQTIAHICSRIAPWHLADLVRERKTAEIAKTAEISDEWAETIVVTLRRWSILFELEALAKQPKPIITVRTKADTPIEIPVTQLSDGQRHTILLTIAMLAESNVPLLIDQPEDDLDNAFIASTIVGTLRAVKERRQVIIVTHNANLAVLGDSELILPMYRENDIGKAKERGSIDRVKTKDSVQDILEGGPKAFLRRKEIYGH